MTQRTDLRSLLVLRGPTFEAEGLLEFLSQHFDVQFAEDLPSALEAMRRRKFNAVLADTADFLPLERGFVTQQASVVLDTIGDGVCIVGPRGELVWANRRLRDFPRRVIESLRSRCVGVYEEFATRPARLPQRGRRFSLMPDEETYYEVICSPVRDRRGILCQVAAVVVDATGQRRQQRKLNAIERAGHELVRLDDDVLSEREAPQRLQVLRDRILRCGRDVLDFEHFAVLLLDARTNRLERVISEGLDEEAERAELFASTEGNGICGYVAATGSSYVCPDVRKDPRYLPGLPGARSSITVPLRLRDKVVGVLNAESRQVAAFGEEDRQFAEMFADHVALALHILNLLVVERHSTQTQVSGSICAALTGPLNDIIAATSQLIEDYIGHDDLRKRLSEIVDTAHGARQSVRQWMEAPTTGVLAVPPVPQKEDPLLTGRRILVADDEEVIRQTVRDVLAPYGCLVDVAADGAEAIAKIEGGRYELVISDIKMPGADGYSVFAAAKAADPQTQVILITGFGYDPNHSVVRASEKGLSAVLMKPFRVKQLLSECRSALSSVRGK
jgi:CheY-like chemotaxis protein